MPINSSQRTYVPPMMAGGKIPTPAHYNDRQGNIIPILPEPETLSNAEGVPFERSIAPKLGGNQTLSERLIAAAGEKGFQSPTQGMMAAYKAAGEIARAQGLQPGQPEYGEMLEALVAKGRTMVQDFTAPATKSKWSIAEDGRRWNELSGDFHPDDQQLQNPSAQAQPTPSPQQPPQRQPQGNVEGLQPTSGVGFGFSSNPNQPKGGLQQTSGVPQGYQPPQQAEQTAREATDPLEAKYQQDVKQLDVLIKTGRGSSKQAEKLTDNISKYQNDKTQREDKNSKLVESVDPKTGKKILKRFKEGDEMPNPEKDKTTQKDRESASIILKNRGSFSGVLNDYKDLRTKGEAGIVGGRVGKAKNWIGMGEREFTSAKTNMYTKMYNTAKGLNGPGVLSNQDFNNIYKEAAFDLAVEPDQFLGVVQGLAKSTLDSSRGEYEARKGSFSPELKAAIEGTFDELQAIVDMKSMDGVGGNAQSETVVIIDPKGRRKIIPKSMVDQAINAGGKLAQ